MTVTSLIQRAVLYGDVQDTAVKKGCLLEREKVTYKCVDMGD